MSNKQLRETPGAMRQPEKPQPLPKPRQRLLTPPPASRVTTRSLKRPLLHYQSQCWLLARLPLEVRLMIWEGVIGGRKLHILPHGKRLRHMACNYDCLACGFYPCISSKEGRSLLSLLKTCRQVYSETINLLYQDNDFVVHLTTIRSLHLTILPKRWAHIRSLHLLWEWWPVVFRTSHDEQKLVLDLSPVLKDMWQDACRSIKMLKSLRRFILTSRTWTFGNPDISPGILEPLKDLRLMNGWELRIQSSEEKINTFSAALKAAGFDCTVSRYTE